MLSLAGYLTSLSISLCLSLYSLRGKISYMILNLLPLRSTRGPCNERLPRAIQLLLFSSSSSSSSHDKREKILCSQCADHSISLSLSLSLSHSLTHSNTAHRLGTHNYLSFSYFITYVRVKIKVSDKKIFMQ